MRERNRRLRELPNGTHLLGDIETAIGNLVIGKADMLPRRSGKSKIKSDRLSLIDGISKYLLRLLLLPNPIGERALVGPHGKASLWHKGDLIEFGADNLLQSLGTERPSLEDFLFLDELSDTPASLMDDPDTDDAFAFTASVVRKSMLCVDPATWAVRSKPLFSIDSFDDYVAQSAPPNRWDFEFEAATKAWESVRPFSGAQLVYSFEMPKHPGQFRRPSEIAKLVEKEYLILCGAHASVKGTPEGKPEAFAKAYIEEFRKLPPAAKSSFNQTVALKMSVPDHLRYRTKADKGFCRAWNLFKDQLSEEEIKLLPGPGRPPKTRH